MPVVTCFSKRVLLLSEEHIPSFRWKTENILKYIFGGFFYYNMSVISILFSKTHLLLYLTLFYLYVFLYLLTKQVLGYLVSLPVYCFCIISEYGNEWISSSLSVSCAFSWKLFFCLFVLCSSNMLDFYNFILIIL